jgi:ribonuclease HI
MRDEQYSGAFDGSAKPNPGEMTIGGIIYSPERTVLKTFSEDLGHGTNNEAEYLAFIRLVEESKNLGIKRISIRGDSMLVVNQVTGLWKVKQPHIRELHREALSALEGFDEWVVSHVLRTHNKIADSLTR